MILSQFVPTESESDEYQLQNLEHISITRIKHGQFEFYEFPHIT